MKHLLLPFALLVTSLSLTSARLSKSSLVLQATDEDTTDTTDSSNSTNSTDLATECSTNKTGSTCIVDEIILFNCSNLTQDPNWNYDPEFLNITWDNYTYVGNYGANASISTITPYYFANSHAAVTIKAQVLFLDDWQDEEFQIYINGTLIYSRTSDVNYHKVQTSVGSRYLDESEEISFQFVHSDSSISLNITSTLEQSSATQSWALCGLQIVPNAIATVLM